eukprot:scaffold8101_cov16-Tisochrysis_lutea.AAC.1
MGAHLPLGHKTCFHWPSLYLTQLDVLKIIKEASRKHEQPCKAVGKIVLGDTLAPKPRSIASKAYEGSGGRHRLSACRKIFWACWSFQGWYLYVRAAVRGKEST